MALTYPLNLLKFLGQDQYDDKDYQYALENFDDNIKSIKESLSGDNLTAFNILIEIFNKNKTFREYATELKVGITFIKRQFIKATSILKKEQNILTLFAGKEVSAQYYMLRDEYIKLNKDYKTKIKSLIGKTGIFNLKKEDKKYLDEWSIADLGLTPKEYIFLQNADIKSIRELLAYNFTDILEKKITTPDFINTILQKTEDFFKPNNEE